MRRMLIVVAAAAVALPVTLSGCSSDSAGRTATEALSSAQAKASDALSSAQAKASEAVSSAAGAASSAASALATAAAGLTPGSQACQALQAKTASLSTDGFNTGADIEEGDVDAALTQLKGLSTSAENIVAALGSQAPADADQWLSTTQEFAARLDEAVKSGSDNQGEIQQILAQYNTPEYQQQSAEISQAIDNVCG